MFKLFKKTVTTIEINQQDFGLETEKNETILQAALRNDLTYPHHCRVGACARCKCKLTEGRVKELTESAYVLSKQELLQGYILACQSIPKTPIKIEVETVIEKKQKAEQMLLEKTA